MLSTIWNALLYKPLVNLLAFLVSVIPGGDIGVAIVVLTILVKVVLYPLSQKQIISQAKMNLLAPELARIKASGKNKEDQAKLTFELYKKHKTNPFSGCLLVLIQIPIIFALYYVFLKGISFDGGVLYSFISPPDSLNMNFLGILDLSQKSILLAALAGISQYFQAVYMPKPAPASGNTSSFQDSFASSMQIQMKYIFPPLIALIAYSVSGAIALYWVVSNVFTIFQQIHASKHKISIVVDGKKLETEAPKEK